MKGSFISVYIKVWSGPDGTLFNVRASAAIKKWKKRALWAADSKWNGWLIHHRSKQTVKHVCRHLCACVCEQFKLKKRGSCNGLVQNANIFLIIKTWKFSKKKIIHIYTIAVFIFDGGKRYFIGCIDISNRKSPTRVGPIWIWLVNRWLELE